MERALKELLPDGIFKDVTPVRSRNMQRIRGRNNKTTEFRLRMALVRAGIKGWKVRPERVEGKPDFAFLKKKIAIFADGCFWHGCPIHGTWPKSNSDFWRNKIKTNQKRDVDVTRQLKKAGWKIVRIWEHEKPTNATKKIVGALRSDRRQ